MKFGVLAAMVGAGLAMCVLSGCETLSQTPGENANMMARTVQTDMRQVPEDIEAILLLDHPSRLSRKPIPND